VQDIITELRL
jgi:ABC-type multidrug transport system ATPase subunit